MDTSTNEVGTNSTTTNESTSGVEVSESAKPGKHPKLSKKKNKIHNFFSLIKGFINCMGKKKQNIWEKNRENISDILIQMLPIWILLLFTYVFNYSFGIDQYTGTLYMYVIIQNACYLSAPLNGIKEKRFTTSRAMCVLLICMSTVMYGMRIVIKIISTDANMDNEYRDLIICLILFGITIRSKLIINTKNIEGDKQNG